MRNGDYNIVVAPDEYPGTTYRDRYCPEYHLVWWQETGEIVGEGEVIHHKNGNKRDNSFENLEKMSIAEHNRIHSEGHTFVVLECPECGTEFSRERRKTHLSHPKKTYTACDKSCAGRYAHRGETPDQEVIDTYKSRVTSGSG